MLLTGLLPSLATVFACIASAVADPATYTSDIVGASIALVNNGSATDLYMKVSAPQANGWGAVAIGEEMKNGLFFILYPSSDGSGVTVSVRTSTGNHQPLEYSAAKYQVMNSSITNGMMSADFVCYGCSTWDLGSLDTTSSSATWMWAHGPGRTVDSNSDSADIQQHPDNGNGNFKANVQAAHYTSSVEASNAITGKSSTAQPASSNSASSSGGSGSSSGVSKSGIKMLVTAHASLLTLTFYFWLPLGVLLLRLVPKSAMRFHYISQAIGTAFAIAGLGIAIYMSQNKDEWAGLDNYHQIIGILVVSFLVVQAIVGTVQHMVSKRNGKKSALAIPHMIFGCIILILGGVQGILGGIYAGDYNIAKGLGGLIAVVWVVTAAGAVYGRRRNAKRNHGYQERKGHA